MRCNSFKIILKNYFHTEYVYQGLDFRKITPLLFVPRKQRDARNEEQRAPCKHVRLLVTGLSRKEGRIIC